MNMFELCAYFVLFCCGYMAESYFETDIDRKIWKACGQILPAAKFIVSRVMELASQQVMIIAFLEAIVHRAFVALVVCGIFFLLSGGYYTLRWLETAYSQRLRRINSHRKATGRSSPYVTHSARLLSWTTPLCSSMLWLPAGITIIMVLWLHPHMAPMSPNAHPPAIIHSTHTDVFLPPSLQPAYAQWFDPPQRDHVRWLENLASAANKVPWRTLFLSQYDAESTTDRASSHSDALWFSSPHSWSSLSPGAMWSASDSTAAPTTSTLALQFMPSTSPCTALAVVLPSAEQCNARLPYGSTEVAIYRPHLLTPFLSKPMLLQFPQHLVHEELPILLAVTQMPKPEATTLPTLSLHAHPNTGTTSGGVHAISEISESSKSEAPAARHQTVHQLDAPLEQTTNKGWFSCNNSIAGWVASTYAYACKVTTGLGNESIFYAIISSLLTLTLIGIVLRCSSPATAQAPSSLLPTAEEADDLRLNPPMPAKVLVTGADHHEVLQIFCTPGGNGLQHCPPQAQQTPEPEQVPEPEQAPKAEQHHSAQQPLMAQQTLMAEQTPERSSTAEQTSPAQQPSQAQDTQMAEQSPLTQHSSPAHQFPASSWSTYDNPLSAEDSMQWRVETGDLEHLITPSGVDSQGAAVQTASHSVAFTDKTTNKKLSSKKQWLRTKLQAAKFRVTQLSPRSCTPQQFPGSRWSTLHNPLFAEDSMQCDVETVDDRQGAAVQTASHLLASNDKTMNVEISNKTSKKQQFRTKVKAAKSRVKRLFCVGHNNNVVDP